MRREQEASNASAGASRRRRPRPHLLDHASKVLYVTVALDSGLAVYR
jgi:hypothetical protein